MKLNCYYFNRCCAEMCMHVCTYIHTCLFCVFAGFDLFIVLLFFFGVFVFFVLLADFLIHT